MPNWKKLITSGSDAHLNSIITPNVSITSTGVLITGSLTVSSSNTFTNIGPMIQSGSVQVIGTIEATQGITGSLLGTATSAVSCSYAETYFAYSSSTEYTVSASLASTASLALTASYVANAVSSSYSLNSLTSSYALNTKATYGSVVQSGQILVNGGNINSPNQTLLTLPIPSAGVWKIEAAINCGVSVNLTMGVALYKPGGTLVANTGNEISNQAGGYFYSAMPLFAIVETTSSANYTLRAWSNGTTDSMTSAGGKTTYAYWTKIG